MGGCGMSKGGFTVDASDFDKAAKALEKAGFERQAGRTAGWALRRIANLVRANVRKELGPHRRTGKMRDRVRVRIAGQGLKMVAGVKTTGSGSNLIVGGVRPHTIAGPVMPLWTGRGRSSTVTGFARAVEHPGFPPDPFFHRGFVKSKPAIQDILKASAKTMASELAYRMRGRA
jgi:hypothetical protein